MPPLPKYFRTLLHDEPLPLQASTGEYLETLRVQQVRVVAQQAVDLLGDSMGHVLVGLGLRRGEVPAPLTAAMLMANSRFMAIAQGGAPLAGDEGDRELVRLCQRALQAAGARVPGAPRELLLGGWGADGGMGQETTLAIASFQAWQGTGGGGQLGPSEATALLRLLGQAAVPDLWAPLPGLAAPSGPAGRIVEIARGICGASPDRPFRRRVDGRTYSCSAEDFGVVATRNGTLQAPGGVSYSLSKGREYWKCNIFGGVCLSLAELPVPTFQYAPGSPRHYPRAERFGDRLAQKRGWTLVRRLDHRDPADPARARRGAVEDGEVRDLLRQVRAGDLLFVDHPGEPGDDGGHTRVCTEAAAAGDPEAAPLFAQARYERAQEQRDGMSALAGGREIQFWLLRYSGT